MCTSSHCRVLSIAKLRVGQEAYQLSGVAQSLDDYYTGAGEASGQWAGIGAERLGLEGDVTADQLRAVLAGIAPGTGGLTPDAETINPHRNRVPGFDLTFKVPKSVSVLYAVSDDPRIQSAIIEAGDAAVRTALGWLEREALHVRRGTGNERFLNDLAARDPEAAEGSPRPFRACVGNRRGNVSSPNIACRGSIAALAHARGEHGRRPRRTMDRDRPPRHLPRQTSRRRAVPNSAARRTVPAPRARVAARSTCPRGRRGPSTVARPVLEAVETVAGRGTFHAAAAVAGAANPLAKVYLWPKNGGSVPRTTWWGGESPDPSVACPPEAGVINGQPVSAWFPATRNFVSLNVSDDGGTIPACVLNFDKKAAVGTPLRTFEIFPQRPWRLGRQATVQLVSDRGRRI